MIEKALAAIKKNDLFLLRTIVENNRTHEELFWFNSLLLTSMMHSNEEIFLYLLSFKEFDLTECNNDLFSDCVGMNKESNKTFFYRELLKQESVINSLSTLGYEYLPDICAEINYAKNKLKLSKKLMEF